MNPLAELITAVKQYKIKPIYYVDRLHVYLDSSTTLLHLQPLLSAPKASNSLNDTEQHKLLFQPLAHYAHFDKKLELFQPTAPLLALLSDVIQGDYRIQYLELALDFESKNDAALKNLQAFFDKHLVYDAQPKKKSKHFHWAIASEQETDTWQADADGTRYFAARQSKNVLAMYLRPQSKVTRNKACLHLEWRFTGLKMLKAQGIITLSQLPNNADFWETKLDLRAPNLTTLGQSCMLQTHSTTRQADINRGRMTWSGITVLQRFLTERPHCAVDFIPISTASKLMSCLQPFFTSA